MAHVGARRRHTARLERRAAVGLREFVGEVTAESAAAHLQEAPVPVCDRQAGDEFDGGLDIAAHLADLDVLEVRRRNALDMRRLVHGGREIECLQAFAGFRRLGRVVGARARWNEQGQKEHGRNNNEDAHVLLPGRRLAPRRRDSPPSDQVTLNCDRREIPRPSLRAKCSTRTHSGRLGSARSPSRAARAAKRSVVSSRRNRNGRHECTCLRYLRFRQAADGRRNARSPSRSACGRAAAPD